MTSKNDNQNIDKKLIKTVGFLDFMVKAVFISTFAFTIIMGIFAWTKEWEQVAITLTERWFSIMVGELVVTGFIQIVKEVLQSRMRLLEMKFDKELNRYENYNESGDV